MAEGRAHAIIPVQTVYDTAIRNDVAVFFITGRKESDRPGTERNLRDVGYEKWTEIFYKPAARRPPKLTRRRRENRGRGLRHYRQPGGVTN